MDDRDFYIGVTAIFVAFALIGGAAYGTYRYGRMAEKRALYEALASSITATYDEGVNDGLKEGKSQGYKQGWAEALKTCDNEYLPSGHY